MVPKKEDSWRPCADYHRFNAVNRPERYPIKFIEEVLTGLAGKRIFSKIDLLRAFHQILIAKSDIPKTTVITPFDLYGFLLMMFGLRNAAQSFQGFIDQTLRGFDFRVSYIDGILVSSEYLEQHEQHLRMLFEQLNSYGLVVHTAKCILGV